GLTDAFSAVLDPAGAALVFSSYFGGSNYDYGYAVAAAPGNRLVLAGMTYSVNFPLSSALQNSLSAPPDGFVLQATYGGGGVPSAVSVSPSSGSGTTQAFSLRYSDSAGYASLQTVEALFNTTSASSASACLVSFQASNNQLSLWNDAGTTSTSVALGS